MLQRTLNPRRAMTALRHPYFRWFMVGRLAAAGTIYMRTVAQGWLVYDLTGSALALGWVSSALALSTVVLAPLGGVMADRFPKRTILIWTRVGLILISLCMALLIFLDAIRAWHVVAVSMLEGAMFAFMMPAQETLYSELVDRETLLNAVSLNAVMEGLMGIVGAVSAGLLIEAVGAGGVYVAMALLFALAGYTHLRPGDLADDARPSLAARDPAAQVDGL